MITQKLILEWIPNAYSAKKTILLKKPTSQGVRGTHPIVKSTGLYKNKKSRC